MKISAKGLLIGVYILITFLAAATIQTNPQVLEYLDSLIREIQELGVLGMLVYIAASGTIMALAIPLQFIDLVVGTVYPVKEAILVLVGSKMLGAAISFYIANYLLSADSKRAYQQNKYMNGLYDLVKKEPMKYGLLIRFASIPIVVRNYGLAVLPINFHKYMACIFISACVTSPFQAYAGSQFTSLMEFTQTSVPQYDENGELIEAPAGSDQKTYGLYIMLLGVACSLFVGTRIKRKVDEINKAAEESKAK